MSPGRPLNPILPAPHTTSPKPASAAPRINIHLPICSIIDASSTPEHQTYPRLHPGLSEDQPPCDYTQLIREPAMEAGSGLAARVGGLSCRQPFCMMRN